jgi:hypothetical protein
LNAENSEPNRCKKAGSNHVILSQVILPKDNSVQSIWRFTFPHSIRTQTKSPASVPG